MPTNHPDTPDDPFDREAFETELAALIDRARRADADIEGAYDVRTPRPNERAYTVEITEIESRAVASAGRDTSSVVD